MRQSARLAAAAPQRQDASSRGGAPTHSGDASTRSQTSFGSAVETVDDDVKAVMVRAVNGMKAREGARFKSHLRTLQAAWKGRAEAHAAQLQGVLEQYQARPRSCSVHLLKWRCLSGRLSNTRRAPAAAVLLLRCCARKQCRARARSLLLLLALVRESRKGCSLVLRRCAFKL